MAHKITQGTDASGRTIYLVGDTGRYAYTKVKAQAMAGKATKEQKADKQYIAVAISEAQDFGDLPRKAPRDAEVRIYGAPGALEGYRRRAGVTYEMVSGRPVPGWMRQPAFWSGTGAEYNKIKG